MYEEIEKTIELGQMRIIEPKKPIMTQKMSMLKQAPSRLSARNNHRNIMQGAACFFQSLLKKENRRLRLTVQGVACAMVLLIAFSLKVLPIPALQKVNKQIKNVVKYDTDSQEILGQLHFLQEAFPRAVNVLFSQKSALPSSPLCPPAKGKVVRTFESGSFEKIAILCQEDPYADVALAGQIKQLDEQKDGTYVIISHENNITTKTGPLEGVLVSQGQKVDGNTAMGVIAKHNGQRTLIFTMYTGDRAVDPLPYIANQIPMDEVT